jgi:hypothetical protein
MTERWPIDALSPTAISVDLLSRPVGGGPALSGGSQWQKSDSGCWYITYTGVSVGNAQKIKCFRAMDGILQGPVTSIIVSVLDLLRAPWPLDGSGNPIMPISTVVFDDGASFDDGAGFLDDPIECVLAAPVGLGETMMQLEMIAGADPEGGHLYTLAGRYLYKIVRVLSVDRGGAHPVFTCQTLPEARATAEAGDIADFNDPSCQVTLIDGNQMPLSLNAGLIGSQTVQFIEDLT